MNNLPKIRIEEIMGQRKTKLLSDQYQLFIIIISGKSEPVVYFINNYKKKNMFKKMLDWCFYKVIDFGHQHLTFDVGY